MRVVEAMRFKMMLLRYLIRVPEHFGLIAESPFLNPEIAQAMLSIRDSEWRDRKWQKSFFDRNGLTPKWFIPPSTQNVVSLKAIIQGDVPSLPKVESKHLIFPEIDHNNFYKKNRVSVTLWRSISRFNTLAAVYIKFREILMKKPSKTETLLELYTKFLLIYPIKKYL
jgi:hypothetical protein